jgi:hypothetical protein
LDFAVANKGAAVGSSSFESWRVHMELTVEVSLTINSAVVFALTLLIPFNSKP